MNSLTKSPFRVLSTKSVYRNPWINVREDKVVHSSGKERIFGVIEMKAGSTVLAINSQNEVFLVKE